MSGIRTRVRQLLKRRVALFLLLIATVVGLSVFSFGTVFAAGELGLGLTAVDTEGNPITSVQSGDIIEYIIDYSCADLTDGCGTLDIQFTLDLALVELVEVITSPSYDYDDTTFFPTIRITNDPVINPTFDGGESAQARIRVRVVDGLDGSETIPASVIGRVNNGVDPPATTEITATTPAIDVEAPTEQWSIVKTQVIPTLPTAPAPGGTATYSVAFCPDSTSGNISITDPILIDNYPPGTNVLDSGGGVVDTLNNTITWQPPTLDNPLNPADGCETVTYTLEFPDTNFSVNDAYTNSASGDGSNPEIDPAGICVADCPNDTINGTIDPPTADLAGTVNKNGPGATTIVAPGDSSGTSVYSLGLDLSGSNVFTNAGVTLTDILPTAPSDGFPATSITEINTGTWGTAPDGSAINAIIEISTTAVPAFTQIGGTLDGSTNQQFTSAGGDFIGPGNGGAPNTTTNLVTGIRITFLSPLPPGFTFNSAPNFRFIVREGMSTTLPDDDYDDGSGTRTYQNCVDADGTYDDQLGNPQVTSGTSCTDFQTSDDVNGFANITTSKSSDVESIFPLEPIQFTLTVTLTEEASGDLINPAIQDTLPPGLTFVSWDSITIDSTGGDTVNNPYLLISGSDLLFYWDSAAPVPGSVDFGGGSPAAPNPLQLVPPVTGSKTITIVFTAEAQLSAAAGPYTNTFSVASESPNMRCQGATESDDLNDIDGDSLTIGDALCEGSDSYSVREAAEMAGQKWIRSIDGVTEGGSPTFDFFQFNDLDNPSASCPTFTYQTATAATPVDFTRYPCVAEGLPNERFEYLMRAVNTGIVDIDNYIMVDVLPFIGDTGVSELVEGQTRDTEFLVFLDGPIVIEDVTQFGDPGFTAADRLAFTQATFTVEYNTSLNPCRGEVANPPGATASYPGGCSNAWISQAAVLALPGQWADVRSFRIIQNNGTDFAGTGIIPSGGGSLIFSAPMVINGYDGPIIFDPEDGAQTGEIAWNSFAHQFDNALSGTELLAAEPPKVGIVVAQRYSVGNRVWIDDGVGGGTANDGIINGTEAGINNIEVQLWRDTGGGFVLFATDTTRTDTSSGLDGYYFFGDLDGGPNIDYQVRIPGYEFDPADPNSDLDNYISSTGNQNAATNNNTDSNDTGIDQTVTTATDNYIINGVSSNTFTLTSNSEATGETDVNDDGLTPDGSPPTNEGPLGFGENQEEDEDSDLTVDFGFFKPMSIGNIVWLDDGSGGGTVNDGVINGTEPGIANVVMGLYAGDGLTEIDDPDNPGNHYQVTTNAQGYYLFDLLPPGDYVVRVMPENFQFGATPATDGPLAPYISSNANPGTLAAENPVDENGVEYGLGVDEEDDRTDHGIDPTVDGAQRTDGVYSAVITLTVDSETTSEANGDKDPTELDGRRVTVDNSDLTVDFGFFQESATNFSIGNFVWFDINNDGVYDADGLDNTAATADDELPIANVEMALWSVDAGGNPLAVLNTTTTDAQGYYVFANLDPGRYVVQMTESNWDGSGLVDLSEYISTTGTSGDTETDQTNAAFNENGNDPTDGNANNTVTDEYIANGVFSAVILLEPEGEPLNEDSNQPNPGAGSGNADDDNSDLTIDFGVFRPMSIGNIVWLDSGITGAGVDITQYNDGIRNGTEPGIANVTVQLFYDTDGDGTPETQIATDTTDADGYYLFDGLVPGNYEVRIPTTNFTTGAPPPLQNLLSSQDVAAPLDSDLDDDDHGADVADPTANPVVSPVIVLTYDSEPLETDTVAAGGDPDGSNDAADGPNRRGNNGETDANSDRTVDFGFIAPPMSIGNRVFFDSGDNGTNPTQYDDGIQNGTEPGIDNVVVNLYDAADTSTVIATVTTAGGGYYIFDNLPPGDYVVGIPASNFTAGQPLEGFLSSTDVVAPADADPDLDDHGINPGTPGNEVFSPTITLATNGENQVDDEAVTGTGSNGETDNNSDLTVDFGFIRPMSIGNRVWLDVDRVTGVPGDGTRQGTENGIANVTLELYLDNGNGVLDGGDTLIAETTTNATGHYLFDSTTTVTAPGVDDPNDSPIGPGNYLVHIPAANFAAAAPLEGLINSDGANGAGTDTQTDSDGVGGDENGVNAVATTPATYPVTAGVTSTTINLSFDNEPLAATEIDRDPALITNVDGVNVEDDNGDFTVDFGFYNALAIGNRVWFDLNADGLIDAGDDNPDAPGNPGIDGVTVYLFNDVDGDGVPEGGPIAQDVTQNGGYYLFDVLDTNAGVGAGDGDDAGTLIPGGTYLVGIDPTAGNNPTLLGEHISTQTRVGGTGLDADVDNDDNGIDAVSPGVIYSEPIVLAHFTETEAEAAADKEAGVDDGRFGIQDHSSNLTVDFGFYIPMSIGNIVWLDNGAVGATTDITQYDDGIRNGTEPGIQGVTVELYGDFDGDGIEDAVPRTDITDAQGYYLFDNLVPGDYRIEIPTGNFGAGQPLVGLISSHDAVAPVDADLDDDDHGIDVVDPTTNPVVSPTITLTYDGEPLETDTVAAGGDPDGSGNAADGPNFRGTNGEQDDNSDRTVDFGFVVPPMSIGNRIFEDSGDNGTNPTQFDDGVQNGTEPGIDGVLVHLYDASDTSTPIATVTTAGGGYYIFDNLPPGDYVVGIPASNFAGGQPLEGYLSSTDTVAPADADPDLDDHGINPATPGNEVFSPTITLAGNTETQPDDEAVTGTGTNGETDINSDLTVDFGFLRPMSIGNRVWLDIDRTTGTPGDGTRQNTEAGIANVAVELYLDNGNGVLDGGDTLIAETTTNATGHYLFDETTTVTGPGADDPNDSPIGPGNYLVHLPAANFAAAAPLEGLINSDGANGAGTDTQTDSDGVGGDENGVNSVPANPATYPQTAGVTSTVINLSYDNEPLAATETDRDPALVTDVDGVNVQDDNGDFTVDFGFYNALAIGNRVWFDGNRDGLIDATDDNPNAGGTSPGIDGVTVYLYADADADGVADGGPIAQDVTQNGGYYLFDVLDTNAGVGAGDGDDAGTLIPAGTYIVGIDPTAGNNATVLANHVNTITIVGGQGNDADIDSDDNGIDRRDVDPDPTIIYSESIVLAHFTESETDADKEAGVGDGRFNIQDNNSNLTVDFGFFVPMSIGNRVWLDSNNDALFTPGDPTEPGINGVIVELFRDDGTGIDLTNDTPYRTTVTNTDTVTGEDGYYIFDDLPPGQYIVRLAPENFQPDDLNPANGVEGALLTGLGPYSSSETDNPPESGYLLDNQTDNNDNGIDENFPQTNGIASNVITLSYNNEPDTTADDDLDTDVGEGTFGELDFNAEMTVDFGVYTPAMSLGNRVFYDYNNDRIFNGADQGVENVIVNLFRDDDNDGVPDSGITNPIETTLTDANGYYIFDGLQPGRYLVQIDENNFRTVTNGVLQDYYSSQDKDAANNPVPPTDNEDDTIENGVDNPFNLANNPDPQAQGVFSPTILLEPSNEVDTEVDLGPEGDGEPNIQASNSDLTVDFGFYQPMSLGNVVWFDTNEDGLFNGAEAGIAGVEVELYLDNGDGVFNSATDTLVQVFDGAAYANSDITDANGYYLFDNLLAGQYFVHIPATNFAAANPLFDHISTQPDNIANPAIAPAPDTDSNDNGTPNDNTATTVGVTSELITLGVLDPNGSGLYIPNGSEPVNELDKSNNPPTPASTYDGPASIGRYGEIDENSDITIDFGFILETNASMSIGNRVWYDEDRSGLIESVNAFGNDEASTGIDGVLVLLYRANAAGTPIGAPIARDVTQNGGYYLFDVLDTDAATGTGDGDDAGGPLTPGNYVVAIDTSNFTAGNVLEGYTSTVTGTDNPGTAAPSTAVEGGYPAAQDDNNDNGTANVTYGILSDLVTLTLQAERDDEDATNQEAGVLNGTDGNGNPITANNSDLTIDFGFYPPMSLGNRVWIDSNNNGVFDAAEAAVPNGVTLTLYQDTNGSGDYTPGVDLPVDNPNTPAVDTYQVSTTNGYYLFENLLPADDYIVVIDPANFNAGGNLVGYTGSDNGGTFEDDTDTDLNDNGRDAVSYTPATDGIPSGLIQLTVNGEPTGEQGSTNPADGPNRRGNNGETDPNSNLTVDFGVFPATYYSIGNRVWSDTNNDGVHDPTESGIPGVAVNLYLDADQDGTPDSLTTVASTNTDANGYYLFDSLPEGNYVVSIAPQNFNTGGPLVGYSTTNQADPSDSNANDDEDNVSDHNNTTIDPDFGILSNTYNLTGAAEPVGETDPTTAGTPQDPGTDPFGNPIPDNQSNLTVDFGFIQTMSLGNRVWFDLNDDGIINPGETGIAGVDVQLYRDDGATSPGVFDPAEDTPLGLDTTDGNGYYLFNDLQPGDYFVNIPNSNWAGPLANMQSSTPDAAANDNADNNDNGTPNTVAPVNGVTSQLITLAFGTAPTNETDLSNNPLDGPNFRGTSNPANNNSNLSIDFGFFLGTPMSIGNRVWFDDGGTTGTPNDGIINGDEAGVPNVIVELYADSNGDGIPDTATPIDTVNTDAQGYYLFDGLPPGQYVVVLSEDNWTNGTLDGYLSTTTQAADNDSQDNGVDNPTPSTDGIRSRTIILEAGTEPTADDEAVTGTGSNGETDDNSNLTVDFGLVTAYDWGDAPDSYGTSAASNGPVHRIISGLYLGGGVDDEGDGQPVPNGTSNNTGDPAGDGTDEDGMVPPVFVAGTTVDVDVTVVNNSGQPATLVGWFDWNGDGVFDAGEGATVNVPNGTNGVVQLTVTIPATAQDDTGGFTYARLRLTNDAITTSDPTGTANSGEVEDYYVQVLDPGILVNKTDGRNSIVAGTVNTYTITIENSGADRLGVRFLDDIPIASPTDATGYDPETITWTCVATNGASCIANSPAGTGSSGGPYPDTATAVSIDELIDLPRNGRVVYTISARVNEQAGLVPLGGSGPLTNTAQLPNEVPPITNTDETDVIFDPPFGVKSGVVNGNNVIRWTMIWYNPGAQQAGVTIGDDVVSPQQLPATAAQIDLQCSGGGAGGTNTGTCSIVGNRIEWNGTMDTSTIANPDAAVTISFNVIVPGPGSYTNTGTINIPGQPPVAAASTVSIGDDGDVVFIEQVDPVIVKFVDPALALPGEDVVWTITVRNPNAGTSVDNVFVSDSMPSQLDIISATSPVGTVTVSGQDISWQIGTLAPLQEVTLTIVSQLADPTDRTPVITNTAYLNTTIAASADVYTVGELPETGEVPWWRTLLMIVGGVLGAGVVLFIGAGHVWSYIRRD